jgi:short-subunit dehydrogenase
VEISGKRILITGGSSGIGFELARALLSRGGRVLITGRRSDQVTNAVERLTADGDVRGVAADVTTPEGRTASLSRVLDAFGGLDILINNAGGVRAGRLDALREDEIRAMIEVNLTAPMLLTQAALPSLRRSGQGLIVNVSSGIALVPLPFYTAYAATKAAIASFGDALRRELAGEGIDVLTVFPTATDTPMMKTSGMNPPGGRESAADVARETVEAIAANRREVVRGDADRLAMVAMNKTDPAAVDAALHPKKDALERAVRDHSAL